MTVFPDYRALCNLGRSYFLEHLIKSLTIEIQRTFTFHIVYRNPIPVIKDKVLPIGCRKIIEFPLDDIQGLKAGGSILSQTRCGLMT